MKWKSLTLDDFEGHWRTVSYPSNNCTGCFVFQALESSWKLHFLLKVPELDVSGSWKFLNFTCSKSSWLKCEIIFTRSRTCLTWCGKMFRECSVKTAWSLQKHLELFIPTTAHYGSCGISSSSTCSSSCCCCTDIVAFIFTSASMGSETCPNAVCRPIRPRHKTLEHYRRST